jgi:hypothetical protein
VFILRILGWRADRAWVNWSDWHLRTLERRLRRLTDLNKVAIKRLARQIRDRECDRVPLPKAGDFFAAELLCRDLEAVGAQAVIETAEPGA